MSLNKNNGIETLDNLDNPSTSIEAESIDVDSLEKKFEEYENLFGNLHDLEKQGKGKNDQEDSHGSSLNHKLSKFDETLDKSNEMQDVHDFSSPAKTQSEVFEKLTDYYNSHNYGKMDYAEYSIDPKWQELNNAYRQENGLEPIEYSDKTNDSQSGAFERLSEYYNSNNYSKMDYPEYSKDPEWQKLNNTYLKEKGQEPIEYSSTVQEPISDGKNVAENVTNIESVNEPGKSTTTEKGSDENRDVVENSDEKLVHNVLENVDTKDTAGSQKELTGDDITEKVPNVAKDTAPENVSGIEKEVNKAIDEGKASDMAEDTAAEDTEDTQKNVTNDSGTDDATDVVEDTATEDDEDTQEYVTDDSGTDEAVDMAKDTATEDTEDAQEDVTDDSSADEAIDMAEDTVTEDTEDAQEDVTDDSGTDEAADMAKDAATEDDEDAQKDVTDDSSTDEAADMAEDTATVGTENVKSEVHVDDIPMDAARENQNNNHKKRATHDGRIVASDTPNDSAQTAFNTLADYMNAHNYDPDDFATYSQDPEWRSLQRKAFPDCELPPLTQENAYKQLSEYMNEHNLGPDDFASYSQDPTWRELQNAAFPNYELPIIHSKEYSSIVEALNDANVTHRPIEFAAEQRTANDIVNQLGGGDLTEGSCSSLAFAYAGNKAGYNVLDFRDGESRSYFSDNDTIQTIANLPGIDSRTISGTDDIHCANELMNGMENGKEYYLATGLHASIVRKTDNGFEFLELQSAKNNGWKTLDDTVLRNRFGCASDNTYEYPNFLIDVDSLGKNEEFRNILGYINTAETNQIKGVSGHAR